MLGILSTRLQRPIAIRQLQSAYIAWFIYKCEAVPESDNEFATQDFVEEYMLWYNHHESYFS